MVFSKNIYCNRVLLCGTSSIASDLVAPTNFAGMEDWSYNRNTYPKLDFVPGHDGIHSYAH